MEREHQGETRDIHGAGAGTEIGPTEERLPRYPTNEEIGQHIALERRRAAVLDEIREILFGAQDSLVSTLAVVSAVGGATGDRFAVLVAGLASALAGVFSMAAGEYISSKSQREVYEAQIAQERREVDERPEEVHAELTWLLQEEGLEPHTARSVADRMMQSKETLLRTMVEKELRLTVDETATPLQGAIVIGLAFGIAALIPILPWLLFPLPFAAPGAVALTAVALFGLGMFKTRITGRNPLVAGFETFLIGAFAGVAGFLFGTVLPKLLGVAGVVD